MFTIDDVRENLVNNSDIYFINIVIDFLNNFYNTYKVLSKEEILERINKLEYIGYNKDQYTLDEDEYATFGSGIYYYVALNSKYKDDSYAKHKSYLYHELTHALSNHMEDKNEVNGLNTSFNDGLLLDEIMTEYYSQILLMNENINNFHIKVFNESKNYLLYSSYYGNGYHLYMPLAKIYDYIFQNDLLKAKFIDTRVFNHKLNDIINKANINFSYKDLVDERNYKKRYYQITEFFIKYLVYHYKSNNLDINLLPNDRDIEIYLSLINQEVINNITIPNRELYFYLYNEVYNSLYKDKKLIHS